MVTAEGDRDRSKRRLIGLAASQHADVGVVTSEPNSESPAALVAAVRSGVAHGVEVHLAPQRVDAIHLALGLAGPGDVVVLTGKGHELAYWVSREAVPFDERRVVRDALRKIGRNRHPQEVGAC